LTSYFDAIAISELNNVKCLQYPYLRSLFPSGSGVKPSFQMQYMTLQWHRTDMKRAPEDNIIYWCLELTVVAVLEGLHFIPNVAILYLSEKPFLRWNMI